MSKTKKMYMDAEEAKNDAYWQNKVIITGLQKAAVVLHTLAFSFKEHSTRQETLALVDAVDLAIKKLEAAQ